MESFEYYQDFIGQLPMLKTYLHFCFGFATPNENAQTERIVAEVGITARRMTESFPWLAGQVVSRASGDGESGVFSMAPCARFDNTFLRRVKDCKAVFPSYPEILEAKASQKVLAGEVLAPRTAFPLSYQESEEDPAPVMALQINIVSGGILLNWACQHNVMDASGLSQALGLFALLMRGGEIPPSAIDWGNRRRGSLIPLLGPGETKLDHSHLQRPIAVDPPLSPAPFHAFAWRDFNFSAESLDAIKAMANDSAGFVDPTVSFVSTNDALTAFCWQRIAAARLELGKPSDAISKLARAVDARAIMKVSPEYMGHMIYIAATHLPLETIAKRPLAYVASALRRSLDEASNEYEIRSFATLLSDTKDRRTIAFSGAFDPELDVGNSSGLSMKWRYDFGSLGVPDFGNRPRFTPIPSTVYIWTRRPDGSVDVMLGLRPQELAIIQKSDEWCRLSTMYPQ